MTPDLSVVVPVFNEEEVIGEFYARVKEALSSLGMTYEILFVDDGSRDRSAEIVREFRAKDPRVRLLRFKANAGETAANDAGFRAARGRYVVTLDADLQNDPRDIPMLLSYLTDWDAATGWRVRRDDPWIRRVSSRIANGVRNAISRETVSDSGCTFRAFRRECLRDLRLYRGLHRFIPTLLTLGGYRVIEVPVNHRPRRFGRSKYGIGNSAFSAVRDLLVVRWMRARQLDYQVAEDTEGGGPEA